MNQQYVKRKKKEIQKRIDYLEQRLNNISKYCKDENEYYATWEWKELEGLEQKLHKYSLEL